MIGFDQAYGDLAAPEKERFEQSIFQTFFSGDLGADHNRSYRQLVTPLFDGEGRTALQ